MRHHLNKLLALFHKQSVKTGNNQKPAETPEELFQKAAVQLPESVLKKITEVVPDHIRSLRIFDEKIPGLFNLEVPSTAAEMVWKQLVHVRAITGYFPIIVGKDLPNKELMHYLSEIEPSQSISSAEEFFERYGPEVLDDKVDESFFKLAKAGSVPDVNSFYILTRSRSRSTRILLFPGNHGYEVLKYLPFGGWNDCPFDEEHTIVLKYWNEKYGAELATMDSDILELYLQTPITDEDLALSIAREQFIYCEDIVSQGTGTLGHLARTILHSHIWFFWWD